MHYAVEICGAVEMKFHLAEFDLYLDDITFTLNSHQFHKPKQNFINTFKEIWNEYLLNYYPLFFIKRKDEFSLGM